MSQLPRMLVHGGRVVAGGLWFDRPRLGEREARRRVLDQSAHTRVVFEVGDGYLVLFERPVRLDAEVCPGVPVVDHGGRWLTAPLRPAELDALAAPPGSLVRVHHARVEVLPLSGLAAVDVAEWIDVSDWSVCETESLGRPVVVVRPRLVAPVHSDELPPRIQKVVPEVDPKRQEILDALADAKPSASRPPGLLGALGSWWNGLFQDPEPLSLPPGATPVPKGTGGASATAPPPPGALRSWFDRMLGRSPLARLIGRRQAEYLHRTMQLFEKGEWDDALRHAIPFSSLPGAPSRPSSLRVPSPRAELRLDATPSAGAVSSLNLGDDLYARFKELYRQAARDLEAQGRIEEAAYVLFELLGDEEEGIAMLERHEEYELAARMAEGRGMAAGLVIRLWFLAKQPARAILVARRTGAYPDAIQRLKADDPELAERLTILWADRLAESGDYAAAVDAVWDLPRARGLARAWIDRAIEFGGPVACRMLPRKLALCPDDPRAHEEVERSVEALLELDDEHAPSLRYQLSEEWIRHGRRAEPTWSALGRRLARQLMLDLRHPSDGALVQNLLRAIDDPVLRYDVGNAPSRLPVRPPASRSSVFEVHERGLSSVDDAIVLPNGRVLLALGDAGLRLVDRHGKTLRQYEHPADELVPAHSGTRCIAISRRGHTKVLRRVDLVTGRAELWCDARFEEHARHYDGAGWFLSAEHAVVFIDAQGPGIDALWRVGGLGGSVVAMACDAKHLSFVTAELGRLWLEVFTYEMTDGGPVLRNRRQVDLPTSAFEVGCVSSVHPTGGLVGRSGPHTAFAHGSEGLFVEAGVEKDDQVFARESHVDLLRHRDDGIALHRLEYDSMSVPAEPVLLLRGSTTANLRVMLPGRELLVTDDRGRVVLLSESGQIERWLLV